MPSEQREVREGMLTLRSDGRDGRHRISLSGELDLANADAFSAAIDDALEAEVPIVLDMRELTFIDSTGIAVLVGLIGRAAPDGLRILPSEAPAVSRVLKLTGLDERMPLASAADDSLGVTGSA